MDPDLITLREWKRMLSNGTAEPVQSTLPIGTAGWSAAEAAKALSKISDMGYSAKDVDPAKLKWQFRDNLSDGSIIVDADN